MAVGRAIEQTNLILPLSPIPPQKQSLRILSWDTRPEQNQAILCAWVGKFWTFFSFPFPRDPRRFHSHIDTLSWVWAFSWLWEWIRLELVACCFSFFLFIIGLWIAFGAIRSFTGFSLYFIISSFFISIIFSSFPSLLIHILSRSCARHSYQRIRWIGYVGNFFILQTNTCVVCIYVSIGEAMGVYAGWVVFFSFFPFNRVYFSFITGLGLFPFSFKRVSTASCIL